MASSPPVLPISVDPPAAAVGSAPIAGAPALGGGGAAGVFIARLVDSARRALADRRPWSELADRSAFARPESTAEAVARARKNLSYFRVNYAAVIAAVIAASLLSNPVSLVVLLGLVAGWCFLFLFRPADAPLVVLGRRFSDRETVAGLVVLSGVVVFLTSVGSVILSALLAGAAVVCLHAAFRVPDDLFLDDDRDSSAGPGSAFLSFLGGAAASSAAPVAARV